MNVLKEISSLTFLTNISNNKLAEDQDTIGKVSIIQNSNHFQELHRSYLRIGYMFAIISNV